MTQARLSNDNIAFLKTATRRLIRAAGGVESAAMVTRVGKSALSDYQNPELPDHFMPIDVAVELEGDTGAFHVTQALCRLGGGTLHRESGRGGRETEDFTAHLPGIGDSIGQVYREAALAMADGAMTEAERRSLIARLEDSIAALVHARNALETAQTGKK